MENYMSIVRNVGNSYYYNSFSEKYMVNIAVMNRQKTECRKICVEIDLVFNFFSTSKE